MRVLKSDFAKYNVSDDEEMDDIGEKRILIIDTPALILDPWFWLDSSIEDGVSSQDCQLTSTFEWYCTHTPVLELNILYICNTFTLLLFWTVFCLILGLYTWSWIVVRHGQQNGAFVLKSPCSLSLLYELHRTPTYRHV